MIIKGNVFSITLERVSIPNATLRSVSMSTDGTEQAKPTTDKTIGQTERATQAMVQIGKGNVEKDVVDLVQQARGKE
jgi:hypothetical protein